MQAAHVKIEPGQVSPYFLVCGDPARAKAIADLCEKSEEVVYNREYRTFSCVYNGEKITVTSHGVGAAGAGICFREIIDAGAKAIIRVGTCGTLQDSFGQGDLVLATGAVREDGLSKLMVPAEYPAIADLDVILALESACKKLKAVYNRGIMLTSDLFYPEVLPSSLELYKKAGVAGAEMECAALFVIASLHGVKAGAVATIDGNPLKWDEGNYDPYGTKVADGKKLMLKVGLEAISALSKAGRN